MRLHCTPRGAALAGAFTVVFVAGMVGTAAAATTPSCSDFTYQEDAQAAVTADPTAAAALDSNSDGVACEALPHRATLAAASAVTTTSSTVPTTTSRAATTTTTAPATTTTSATATPTTTTTTTTTTTATTTTAATDLLNCTDFATQAAAQAIYSADTTDPNGLDADHDGVACEDSFGTTAQQVAVFPNGAVQTGGTPLR